MTVNALPLVCTETLHSLEESHDGEFALCRNFVCRYVDIFVSLFDAVSSGDKDDALDAALSLRGSSMMVGAARTGKLTSDFIWDLETGCDSATTNKLAALRTCGSQTAGQLTSGYVNVA